MGTTMTQNQTVTSQLLASNHMVSFALLAPHNYKSRYIHIAKKVMIRSKKMSVYPPLTFAFPLL